VIPQEEFEHGEEEFGYGSAEGGEQNEAWDSLERCSACIGCRSLAWRTSGAARAAARETKCNGRGERGVMKMERVSRKREEQSAVEAFWALGAPGPKKRLKRPDGELGLGGKGAENGPPGPPFSATFHRYVDLSGEFWAS
jgi:hypothetical protein